MYRLQVRSHLDAAHFLKFYDGKCQRMHGHRWDIEVCLQGETLDTQNMLIDFSDVKKAMELLIEDKLDHYVLNDQLKVHSPTAEFLAKWIFDEINAWAMNAWTRNLTPFVRVVRVCVWESPECCVKYSPDMKSTGG